MLYRVGEFVEFVEFMELVELMGLVESGERKESAELVELGDPTGLCEIFDSFGLDDFKFSSLFNSSTNNHLLNFKYSLTL